ncbi:MAG: hypothetical protein U1E16_07210 [Hyphomicrobiales bacterium]
MPEQWLTYRQLAELWNTTPEAARARCRRGNYQRRTSELGTAEVLVDTDALAADSLRRSQPGTGWVSPPPQSFYTQDPSVLDELSLKSLQQLEAQVAALSKELGKAEEQVEMMRKHLAAEREQVAHLMTVLLRSEKRKGFFGRLLFWRKAKRTALHPAGQAGAHSPDLPRPGAAHGPYIGRSHPDAAPRESGPAGEALDEIQRPVSPSN